MNPTTKVFKSKADLWILVMIYGSVFACLAAAGFVIYHDQSLIGLVLAVFLAGVGAGLPLWLLQNTRYEISTDCLYVFSGPFKWTIKKSSIRSVKPSKNPISSPALSLDRLLIQYEGNKTLLVSPLEQQAFVDALQIKS